MRKHQKQLVDGILKYERDYMEQKFDLCKGHHLLNYYGLSRHKLYVRNLAMMILGIGEDKAQEAVEDWNYSAIQKFGHSGASEFDRITTRYEFNSAKKLARRLRIMFYGGSDGVLDLIKKETR